jgi:hypothetical protein
LERRAFDLPEIGRSKRRKEGAGKPVPRFAGNALERRKTQESIGPLEPLGSGRDTDPRGEESPEVAGHRDPLVLRAEERDVRNGMRATAPKGVRLCEGEKLCRVNPMSGSDPRDRKVPEGGSRQEGEKP